MTSQSVDKYDTVEMELVNAFTFIWKIVTHSASILPSPLYRMVNPSDLTDAAEGPGFPLRGSDGPDGPAIEFAYG